MSATINACPKHGTLHAKPLALMEALPTDPNFGPGSGISVVQVGGTTNRAGCLARRNNN